MKGILYLNQFFGQIGGEELADFKPEIREGLVGPAMALQQELGDDVEITHTVICGDNFMGSNTEEAVELILSMLKGKEMDVFFCWTGFPCRTLRISLRSHLQRCQKGVGSACSYLYER